MRHAKGLNLAALFALGSISLEHAQSSRPAFEVASIKPVKSGRPGMSIQTDLGRFKAINATASFLIQYAYGIKDFQLMGGPSWIRADIYDIDARSDIRAEDREFTAMMPAVSSLPACLMRR
jgi:hypothetical protein